MLGSWLRKIWSTSSASLSLQLAASLILAVSLDSWSR